MDFVAFDVSRRRRPQKTPFSVESRCAGSYQRVWESMPIGLAGHRPRRLVVHKLLRFTDEEVAGCADAWGAGRWSRVHQSLAVTMVRRRANAGSDKSQWSYAMRRGTTPGA